ncbi:PEP-CTERM sorting domain-containing protein [Chlorobium sp. N1]|uniref:PEP-CTERM sorting domain-containing protein n=1 Tax=Chlorobium sp. N1 TaxID=2491138 RepID=UPI00103AECE8|nr:PEP-CTERM sorting domain-containing protein [Chlorobium sp. N1]TCD47935.1 PEP-CTERM sorting domain-containing protein [Chlorobium sp. N1]
MDSRFIRRVPRLARAFACFIALTGLLHLAPAKAEADTLYLNFNGAAGSYLDPYSPTGIFTEDGVTWLNPTTIGTTEGTPVALWDFSSNPAYQTTYGIPASTIAVTYGTALGGTDNGLDNLTEGSLTSLSTMTLSAPGFELASITMYYSTTSGTAPTLTYGGIDYTGMGTGTYSSPGVSYTTYQIPDYAGDTITLSGDSGIYGMSIEASPVPEPATYLLLGIGGLAVAFIRKRQLMPQAA